MAERRDPVGGFEMSIKKGDISFQVKISNKVVLAGLGLGLIYVSSTETKETIVTTLCLVAKRWCMTVGNILTGSLLVELHCHSPEGFLQFLDDYELGNVGKYFSEEFSKIGIEEVTVEVENKEEVLSRREAIR